MIDLAAIQQAIRDQGLDGWLLVDFRGTNPLARRVLQCDPRQHSTRRLACCIPAHGSPRRLVHRIEAGALDHIDGEKIVYLQWREFDAGLGALVAGLRRVAMEYSPRNANPYVAKVDAGTVELVRSFGTEVVSSGDLIQLFEASWSDEQWQLHRQAEQGTTSAYEVAWSAIAQAVRDRGGIRETAVQQIIMEHFARHGLVTDHPPIVGVGPHSGDPHYAPEPGRDAEIRAGDLVLVDLWAKCQGPKAVYSDLTRMGYVGTDTPDEYERIFQIVRRARDTAIDRIRTAMAAGERLAGWQVDRACRAVIEQAGYGERFVHRTGHSIGDMTHGNGANMDDLETHDERLLLPRTCFSIEPGIYLPEFGMRSEVNVYLDAERQVHVTGGPVQQQIVRILAEY